MYFPNIVKLEKILRGTRTKQYKRVTRFVSWQVIFLHPLKVRSLFLHPRCDMDVVWLLTKSFMLYGLRQSCNYKFISLNFTFNICILFEVIRCKIRTTKINSVCICSCFVLNPDLIFILPISSQIMRAADSTLFRGRRFNSHNLSPHFRQIS